MEIGKSKDVAEREEQGTVVHVRDETGELQYYPEGASEQDRKPVTITVIGTYSRTYRKARQRARDKNIKTVRNDLSAEGLEAQEIKIAAECIKEWEGFTSDGKPFEYSVKNAVLLLEAPYLYEQVFLAMNDHESFSTAPSRS